MQSTPAGTFQFGRCAAPPAGSPVPTHACPGRRRIAMLVEARASHISAKPS
ncbi:hypothetical protein L665_00297 [Ralstonia solanacearum SD54]|nr:hypothetical protein F504_4044 [Ralstonia pseudosolanacearum FQY_4]ARU25303.1 hypothetical protein RSSE_p1119 [Ralstonia solanacearum]ESS51132.1 hypothetical protein L665_00297 [Ralstonia solanacearum SD54]